MSTPSARAIFDILRLIGTADRPLGASDVRRLLDLKLTTAHRGLNTLEQAGFAARHQASTKFVLGDMSRAVLQSFLTRYPLRGLALPYAQRLTVMTGETTSLFVPIGWYAVRIASVKGTNEVIHTGPVGECFPLGGVSAGRAMLSAMTGERRDAYSAWAGRAGHGDSVAGLDGAAGVIIDDAGTPLGALAVESVDGAASGHEACAQVAGQLSHVIGTGQARIADPYAGVDPDGVRLPTGL